MLKGLLPPHWPHKIENISWLYQTLLEVAIPTSDLWRQILKSTQFQPLPGLMCFRGVWPQIQVPDQWSPMPILFTSDHFRHETQFCKNNKWMDSSPHFKKRYQHKMVPFRPFNVLCLEKMHEAAMACCSHPEGEADTETDRDKEDQGSEAGPRWSLPGTVLPLKLILCFIIV